MCPLRCRARKAGPEAATAHTASAKLHVPTEGLVCNIAVDTRGLGAILDFLIETFGRERWDLIFDTSMPADVLDMNINILYRLYSYDECGSVNWETRMTKESLLLPHHFPQKGEARIPKPFIIFSIILQRF